MAGDGEKGPPEWEYTAGKRLMARATDVCHELEVAGRGAEDDASVEKMREWWDINGGMLIHGQTPLMLAIANSDREHYQVELRREFLSVFGEDLVHMDGAMLRTFKDGAYLNELRKVLLKKKSSI